MEVLSAAAAEQERWLRSGSEYIGRRCLRCSGEREVTGRIEAWLPEEDGAPALWRCRHDDGDEEDLDEAEVRAALAAAGSDYAGSNPNAPTPAAASAAGLVSVSPNRPSRGSPGSVRSRRPASASLVQAIAMCQHKQRVVAERRAQAKSICAALVGKRVIVQWNEDEAYAGEAAVDADGSHPTSGEQTILVKYDDGEEIEETIEPNKFREIPKAYKYPACETCGGDELARLRFCEGCEAAHHEGCAMHAISVQCGRNTLLRKEWFCTKCTEKQADCKACKGGRCAHTCEDGPWRVRHARYGKGGNQPRTPGATWCRPTAYRLPRLLGSSSRAHAHTRTLSFGGGLQEEKWSAEEDENLRLLVERDGTGEWSSKADEFNSMPNSSATAIRSDSALRHRWIALKKQAGAVDQDASNINGLGSAATGASASSSSSSSSSRKRHRERTSLSYDEIVDRLDLDDDRADVHSRIFEALGRAELLKLLRTHDVDVYQRIGTRMKKTKHMLVDDVCKLIQQGLL